MLGTSDSETEILLGNKQLVGIFVVVAVLLGVAFTAGYMVGHNGSLKKPVQTASDLPAAAPADTSNTAANKAEGGQTHTVGSDDNGPLRSTAPETSAQSSATPLGVRKPEGKTESKAAVPPATPADDNENYSPRANAKYLQVAAVNKDEAQAVADVLHRKGFRAHAVPKPGNAKIYRVIIGPLRDAGDLSNTRDALRKTGFREVIVQTY